MSKKCTNCGTELKEKAKFCPVCGTAVPEEINEVVKPKIAGKKIAMAVVAGAVLVGGGFAVYGKIGAKSSQQKEPVKVENSTKKDETAKTEQKEQEEPQKEETGSYRYQWMVQPEIEADQKVKDIFTKYGEEIAKEVLAESVVADTVSGYQKEWNINGETVVLGVEKK